MAETYGDPAGRVEAHSPDSANARVHADIQASVRRHAGTDDPADGLRHDDEPQRLR